MLPYRDSRIIQVAIVIFFILVAFYAVFEIRGMLFGPTISIASGTAETHERFIVIKGRAARIADLKMNGASITVTEDGAFEEPYLLSEGLNRIFFDAADKYGRRTHEVLEIVYTPLPGLEPIQSASSTSSSASTTPMAQ